ncbi:MAG: hypothetical protein HY540_03375 [Deltaproteobacteria bacterium]|nr:hypothetical protein [Deltaproteobacteria bacterium]
MITILIGHRGAGKSALLRRIKMYLPDIVAIDLDAFIEEQEGMSIAEIFSKKGEAIFRTLEKKHFHHLIQNTRVQPLYVAVGAGFNDELPKEVRVLWIRRETDAQGRILLSRPRLDANKSQLQTSQRLFAEREARYERICTDVLTIPEGFDRENEWEKKYFQHGIRDVGGLITLLPQQHINQQWIGERCKWGITAFELRKDLLSAAEFQSAEEVIPKEKVYYADSVCDLHDRLPGESLSEAISRLDQNNPDGKHLKLAVEIHSFHELLEGDAWMMADPEHRSFLPRSHDGRFQWYRLLRKGVMKINFIREGKGSAIDQPLLLDWVRTPKNTNSFAAILGDPVTHSLTPAEHHDFFAAKGMPVFRIRVTESEWESGAFEVLQTLGLRYAAITSPLKRMAYASCAKVTAEAKQFQCVNTLFWDEKIKRWSGANTDVAGFQALVRELGDGNNVAVWGAGALLPMMQNTLPQASFYSSRSGEVRAGTSLAAPRTIIWATSHRDTHPPSIWAPENIIDLNYTQNSAGLDFAERLGIPYLSGLAMFRRQAEEQRKYWSAHAR